ncbi:transposase [Streptomyces sp. NPDC003753]
MGEWRPGRVRARASKGQTASQFIPGWPYSFVAVLEMGAMSWTQILDTVRLGPADDATAVTAAQLRDVVERLIAAGQWQPGEPDIVIVTDAGYDVTRLAWMLRDLPVELIGRIRGDRVMRLPKPPRVYDPKGGRPPKHGPEFRFAKPETWPDPAVTTRTATAKAVVLEDGLQRRGRGPGLAGVPATLRPGAHIPAVQADPGVDPPAAAGAGSGRPMDLADHRCIHPAPARPLARDLRHPWEKPVAQSRLTPAWVRRTFRNLRQHMPCPAKAPKPHQPGPGRPPGTRNRRRAPRYDVGKTVRREKTLIALQRLKG